MDRNDIAIHLIDKSSLTIKEICNEIDIHRSNIKFWRDGVTSPKKSTINKLADFLNVQIKWNNANDVEIIDENIKVSSQPIAKIGDDKVNMSASKILEIYDENRDLRKENIELLNKLEKMKNKSPLKSKNPVYNEFICDFTCEVLLHFDKKTLTMGRTIVSIDNLEKQSKILGYSVDELKSIWNIGIKYNKMSQHPIDTILTKQTIASLRSYSEQSPSFFKGLRNWFGGAFVLNMEFIKKDGSTIHANSVNQLIPKEYKVLSKTKFIESVD